MRLVRSCSWTASIPKPTPNATNLATLLPPCPQQGFEVTVVGPLLGQRKDQVARISSDKVDVHSVALKWIISVAWVPDDDETEMIANAPKWLDKDHFDISAKASNESISSGEGPC